MKMHLAGMNCNKKRHEDQYLSEPNLCSSPMSSLSVVTNLVVSAVANPVRQSTVLLDHDSNLGLPVKRLVRSHLSFFI